MKLKQVSQNAQTVWLWLVVSIIIFMVPSAAHAAIDQYSSWSSRAIATDRGTFAIRMIHISLANPYLQVKSLTANSSSNCFNRSCATRSLQSYVDEVGGFAGINGSYFCPSDYASCAGKAGSFDWLWYNSRTGVFTNTEQNKYSYTPVVVFDQHNNYYFYWRGKDWHNKAEFEAQYNTKLAAVISNGPGLIFEGRIVVTEGQLDNKQRTVKSNRSGIGFNGSDVYLVVASGATVMDLSSVFKSLGAQYAVNLDGGGSSAMIYDGRYGVGPGRNLPNALVFAESAIPVAKGSSFFAYTATLRGGFFSAVGNVTGDDQKEIITGPGNTFSTQVRIFSAGGTLLNQFFAYAPQSRFGTRVATCDIDNDGTDEIVTVPGKGGRAHIRVFNAVGVGLKSFYALDRSFTGGAYIACGDLEGDGSKEIIVAGGQGSVPRVEVYSVDGVRKEYFYPYNKNTYRDGLVVAVVDLNGDGRDEIGIGRETGAPAVQLYQKKTTVIAKIAPGWYPFNQRLQTGVSLVGGDINGDGKDELLVGAGNTISPLVKAYNGRQQLVKQVYAYASTFKGGVNVAGGDVDGDGIDELITTPRSRGGPQVRIISMDEN